MKKRIIIIIPNELNKIEKTYKSLFFDKPINLSLNDKIDIFKIEDTFNLHIIKNDFYVEKKELISKVEKSFLNDNTNSLNIRELTIKECNLFKTIENINCFKGDLVKINIDKSFLKDILSCKKINKEDIYEYIDVYTHFYLSPLYDINYIDVERFVDFYSEHISSYFIYKKLTSFINIYPLFLTPYTSNFKHYDNILKHPFLYKQDFFESSEIENQLVKNIFKLKRFNKSRYNLFCFYSENKTKEEYKEILYKYLSSLKLLKKDNTEEKLILHNLSLNNEVKFDELLQKLNCEYKRFRNNTIKIYKNGKIYALIRPYKKNVYSIYYFYNNNILNRQYFYDSFNYYNNITDFSQIFFTPFFNNQFKSYSNFNNNKELDSIFGYRDRFQDYLQDRQTDEDACTEDPFYKNYQPVIDYSSVFKMFLKELSIETKEEEKQFFDILYYFKNVEHKKIISFIKEEMDGEVSENTFNILDIMFSN